ncbi:MAG: 1-deoxy-D-xylulose-5-phosphate synthase [Corynebacterium sp.]|uniref:1-deoxy-D-xylulose-5-phosphate synthase n=1 Tax=Corynebacterium sp. TaxID=1720 RepID=UPI0027109DAE|nr:1-deoxy-D-xylulose-5-phosphate synthase [Corynebacterium sp.]
MGILSGIASPADLKALPADMLNDLAAEVRALLVEKVSATGGHLGPNLGVVELSIALHRVFESPQEPIIFDTSHQSYVHKMLTGRAHQFDTLRKKGGLSGYTDRAESEHDWTESSHASAALSYADGLAKAKQLTGDGERNVVAVVGDGALTGGMCWEALNNIASGDRNVVVVINDNGRSYSPTIGGVADNLAAIRTRHGYDELMEEGKKRLKQMGWVGERTYEALAAFKEGVKSQLMPTEMFSDLGLKYVGPVNGHDLDHLLHDLEYAKGYEGPIIVHVVTEKGHGFAPAVNDVKDQMHATGIIDPVTGLPSGAAPGPNWTSAFSEELVAAGRDREDVVAITAAMAGPTGLQPFADEFPERFFDVGIAEAHAVTSAAGLALGGMHPVVALYSTFLNRGFDQLLMDVGLLELPVTLVLDRAGVTGSDGASHNGVWDLAIASIIPGIRIAAPRDGARLREQFQEALAVDDGPTVVRFPKGELPADVEAVSRLTDGVDILRYSDAGDEDPDAVSVLIVSAGALTDVALAVAEALAEEQAAVTVVDPRWVAPVPGSVLALADDHDLVVTVEDGVIRGGVGSLISEAMNAAEIDTPIRHLAFPDVFPRHASRSELLAEVGLDAEGATASVLGWMENLFDRD